MSDQELKKISVCGLGKLGACIAATLAARGFEVIGIDSDEEKVNKMNAGENPVEEPNLAAIIQQGKARLSATTDYARISDTDATFFILPTPSLPDGSFSNDYMLTALREAARAVRRAGKKGHLFVCNSTVTPGTSDSIFKELLETELDAVWGKDFGFCYNPEFIALGNVVNGLLEPDMVLIGESDEVSGSRLEKLYLEYNTNKPTIARMSTISAELTKISLNSYITMKISFTNQVQMLADAYEGASVRDILSAIGSDSRVGKKYFNPGLSYGGPCFPRDNRLVSYIAEKQGVPAPLASASDQINKNMNDFIFRKVTRNLTKKDKIVILGLTYKPDTYVVEEAAGYLLAKRLKEEGFNVIVHDCAADKHNVPELAELDYLEDVSNLKDRDDIALVFIGCAWPQYDDIEVHPNTTLLRF